MQTHLSRVYKICTASPEPKSEELYANISNYFDEKSQEKAMMLNQYEAQQLLEEYTEKWTRYQVIRQKCFEIIRIIFLLRYKLSRVIQPMHNWINLIFWWIKSTKYHADDAQTINLQSHNADLNYFYAYIKIIY